MNYPSTASLWLLAVATASLAACDADDGALLRECTEMPALDAFATLDTVAVTNRAQITEARLAGDCLYLEGAYGGGCVEDDLRATAVKSPLAVFPPIYTIYLYDAASDPCEALESGSASFSLAGVRARDAAFDLTFEGLGGAVVEVR